MKTSVWFSWLIFVIAIAALCVAIARCEPITADWISVDIGILAALATCLVGWQIYTLIDLRNAQKSFRDMKNGLEKEIFLRVADLYNDFASVYGGQGDFFFRTCYVLRRIIFLSKAGEYKRCDDEIETLLFFAVDHKLEVYKHKTVYSLLDQIENASKISKMRELREFIRKHYQLDEEDAKRHRLFEEFRAKIDNKPMSKKQRKKK